MLDISRFGDRNTKVTQDELFLMNSIETVVLSCQRSRSLCKVVPVPDKVRPQEITRTAPVDMVDKNKNTSSNSFGFTLIEALLSKWKGTMKIITKNGTQVKIEIPDLN